MVWCEINTKTGKRIEPRGRHLIGKSVVYRDEVCKITNTDPLFPTDNVLLETPRGTCCGISVEVAEELLGMQA